MDYEDVRKKLNELKFFRVMHPVVVHHLKKDFIDYDVTKTAFYIKPVGNDFLHVAVVEYRANDSSIKTQVKYTCAADDLLYGLRIKFRVGDESTELMLINIENLSKSTRLSDYGSYVRQRFGNDRTKAKVRAFFVMLKDKWRSFF